MNSVARWVLAQLGAVALGAMAWQHIRYLRARREKAQDRQPVFYSQAAFHVLTFVEIDQGKDLVARLRPLCRGIESEGGSVIYAGRAVFTHPSEQIGARSWNAVLLAQYPSESAYRATQTSNGGTSTLGEDAGIYTHGMKRPRLLNLLIPQMLLGLRVIDVLGGRMIVEPLSPSQHPDSSDRMRLGSNDIESLRAVEGEALVVVNLIKNGTGRQQKANRSYGLAMMRRMAASTHGPMHMGRALAVDGHADFDDVAIVYYPGPSYFADLLESEFFAAIIGEKQLSDTQVVPTIPILNQLADGRSQRAPAATGQSGQTDPPQHRGFQRHARRDSNPQPSDP